MFPIWEQSLLFDARASREAERPAWDAMLAALRRDARELEGGGQTRISS